MTADLVGRLRESMQAGEAWAVRKEGSDGSGLMAQLSHRLGEAAREIERLRASPPVDEILEVLAPFADYVRGQSSANIPDDMPLTADSGFARQQVTAKAFRRAREVSDRLKGEGAE